MTTNIFFRTDASSEIGVGHIFRCLTLAKALQKREAKSFFMSSELTPELKLKLELEGITVHPLPSSGSTDELDVQKDTDAVLEILNEPEQTDNCLIIDHYKISQLWELKVAAKFQKVMVIDDLADRPHLCDILLDATLCRGYENRYDGLLPKECKKFLGPKYALLREEFRSEEYSDLQRTGNISKVLVSFGGSDPTNAVGKTLEAIRQDVFSELSFVLIAGSINPGLPEIIAQTKDDPRITVLRETDNMAKLMAECDLAIGAGGSTSWERSIMKLPGIVITTAPNQQKIAEGLHEVGAVWNLGASSSITAKTISEALAELISNPERVKNMAQACEKILPRENTAGIDHLVEAILN